MFGWGQKAETTVGALSKERERLAIVAEELDLRRRDAATAYATGIEQRLPRGRLRALLGIRQSVERRLETVARLQLKLDQNIEALESTQLVTSVLGSLKLGTSVLSKVPGKEGDAFGAVDDNAIALDEVSELTGAVSGAYDPVDDDLEAELDRDLGVGDAPGIQDGLKKGVPGNRDCGTTVGGNTPLNGASGGDLDLPSAPTAVPESSFHGSGRGAGVAPVVSRAQLLEMSRRPPRLAGFGS